MNLNKCDNCGNRNIMCCVCEKNKHYRETDFSHDVYIRNKAIDDFAELIKNRYPLTAKGFGQIINDGIHKDIDEITEQLKVGAK